MKTIRCQLTLTFDQTKVREAVVKNRLDELLARYFARIEDWDLRWVAEREDAPLFGAARRDHLSNQQPAKGSVT